MDSTKSPLVHLIPWDPESPSHIALMTAQRVACGWKSEKVESWREEQRTGDMNLQWIVPTTTPVLPSTSSSASASLTDTAPTFGAAPRTPTLTPFVPAGHIALTRTYETPGHMPPTPHLYFISNFFISPAQQSSGLGRAAMDLIETLATSPPLNARTLALSTAVDDGEGREEKLAAFGREAPRVSTQRWYERRGYVPFKRVREMWWETDGKGREWPTEAVFMRKDIK
ncbi:hypothetical protein LHYA1_G005999 [Lachnellula hyalina]|uniref:N-acetyltransferase domain-containing protein n=1 Tax=Lachnellula hyalina TaxID=1316788 RepID=A0A8H8U0U6_9HELO|nr:uncharacterized protein LHYA1_G005999 [Lachnellula hyalina]TVY26366.1 hypothetical protein LHYA1_G005999 [Lachnellula hyalina]